MIIIMSSPLRVISSPYSKCANPRRLNVTLSTQYDTDTACFRRIISYLQLKDLLGKHAPTHVRPILSCHVLSLIEVYYIDEIETLTIGNACHSVLCLTRNSYSPYLDLFFLQMKVPKDSLLVQRRMLDFYCMKTVQCQPFE